MALEALKGMLARLLRSRPGSPQASVGFETWTIPGIRFDDSGCQAGQASETTMTWSDPHGAAILLTRRDRASDPRTPDLAQARIEERHVAAASGRSIVSVDARTTPQQVPAVEIVTKARRGLGFDYAGTLRVSDGRCDYTVQITADEGSMTGTREAMVNAQMIELDEIELLPPSKPGGPRTVKGWYRDPYDPTWDDDAVCSVTDDARVDACFPQHPLTRVRGFLRQARESLVLDAPPDPSHLSTDEARPGPVSRAALSSETVRELLWKTKQFAEIEALLEDELAGIDPSADSVDAAERLLLLGVVRAHMSRQGDAREPLSQAHRTFQRLHGDDHPKTALTLGHLARANLDLCNLRVAKAQFLEALPRLEKYLPGHLMLAMVLNGYGRLLLEQDDANAMECVEKARQLVADLGGGQRFFLLRESAGAPPPRLTTRIRINPAAPLKKEPFTT
jgi:hypothetical protein